MLRLEQNVLLILNVLHLLLLEEQVLVDPLHRVHLAHLAIGDKEDLSEAALVNNFVDLEILQRHCLSLETWLANQHL